MQENWCALALAVLSERFITLELAFKYLELGEAPKQGVGRPGRLLNYLTDEDTVDMIALKKELTLGEIGEIYGVTDWAVSSRIKFFKRGIRDEGKAEERQKVGGAVTAQVRAESVVCESR